MAKKKKKAVKRKAVRKRSAKKTLAKVPKGALCTHCIVKRHGHTEEFDEKKVYGSTYAACLSAHISHMEAEKIAGKVCKAVKKWALQHKALNSNHIFKKIVIELGKLNEDAAFMFDTHRDIQ